MEMNYDPNIKCLNIGIAMNKDRQIWHYNSNGETNNVIFLKFFQKKLIYKQELPFLWGM